MAKVKTTIRESEAAKQLLAQIAEREGLTVAATRELIVREAARKRGITVQKEQGK